MIRKALRNLARRHLSPERRARVARRLDRTANTLTNAAAFAAAEPLRILPDGIVLAIRERLEMRRKLDYPSSRLDLLVTSEIERRTRLWSCRKEPETVEWLHTVLADGGVLYDVGANVGAYSLIAGRLVEKKGGAVYAFEPGYRTYANLVDNVIFNGLGDVIVSLPFAAHSVTGLARFGYSETSAGSANHEGLVDGKVASVANQSMVGCSLDDSVRLFALRPPTCMKIDIDGGEVAVLRGAATLMNSPVLSDILIEIDEAAETATEVRTCLQTAGFKLVAEHRRGASGAHNLIWSRR